MKRTTLLLASLLLSVWVACGQITITHETVEYQDGSQPLATNVPRFSWRYETEESNVKQTSYRIIVASTKDLVEQKVGDLWDTKTVASDRMLLIPYEGKPLHSRDRVYWKVITSVTHITPNTDIGNSTIVEFIESDINTFEISLLDSSDWKAKWIGGDFYNDNIQGKTSIASRYLRKEFALSKNIREARLYISGLGQYSAYLNGQEVAPTKSSSPPSPTTANGSISTPTMSPICSKRATMPSGSRWRAVAIPPSATTRRRWNMAG